MRQVIYAWNYLEWGGAQIHLLALIKEVRKEFDVTVVMPAGSDAQFIKFLDELGVRYEFFPGHLNLSPQASLSEKIRRHLTKFRSEAAMLKHLERFDLTDAVVHVDLSPQQSLFSLMRLCRRTPVFITSHNSLPPVPAWREALWKAKMRIISRFSNFNVFCSNENARNYFRRYYSPELAERIKVTYTSVNPDEIETARNAPFDRNEQREKYGLDPEKFTVLAVGQFIDRKGRWTFLEAAQQAIGDSDMQFVWLTPKMPPDADIRRIEGYGLGDSFRLVLSETVGAARQDVLQFFRVADIFVLPSFVEGLPIALLEAMALGIPSISTNVNAIPEAVKPNETGILVEAGDAEALTAAIVELSRGSELRNRLAGAGRELVLDRFDERKAAQTALGSYKAALELKNG